MIAKRIWWLSFATEKGNLGVVVVRGNTMRDAMGRAWALGINPGGEVQGYDITRSPKIADGSFSTTERKLSAEEIARWGGR